GRWVALGGWTATEGLGRGRLVDPNDARTIRELTFPASPEVVTRKGYPDSCRELARSPDGRWLVAGSLLGGLHRGGLTPPDAPAVSWKTHSGREWPADLAFGGARPLLLAGMPLGGLRYWDPTDGWAERTLMDDPVGYGRPAVDPVRGRLAVVAGKR